MFLIVLYLSFPQFFPHLLNMEVFTNQSRKPNKEEGSILITARIINRHICTVWTFNTALAIVLCIFLIVSLSYFMRKLFYTLFFFSPFISLIHLNLSILHSRVIHATKQNFILELISSSSDLANKYETTSTVTQTVYFLLLECRQFVFY